MIEPKKDLLCYLSISDADEAWGNVVTTVGYQSILPGSVYPLSRHPGVYDFKPQTGRILNEYQLVYITRGSGYFSSQSCKRQPIKAGTILLLFPGEWHSYYPDTKTGWDEYWVGFRGPSIDRLVTGKFFSIKEPVLHLGVSATLVNLYDEIIRFATEEKYGYQPLISGLVSHMLGYIFYKVKNNSFTNMYLVDKINEARALMKDHMEEPLSPEKIASMLGLSYSLFRRTFKEYTGISPMKYQTQLKLLKAKELLTSTSLTISEIAYRLHFENAGQFSTFFHKKEKSTPSDFRKRNH